MGNYLSNPGAHGAMRIRLSHENKACDLTMTQSDNLGALKQTAHSIFKIAYDRVRLVHDGNDLSTHPDTALLGAVGIKDDSIVNAEVTPAVVVQKKTLTPEETLAECESSATEIKVKLDSLLQRAVDWKEADEANMPSHDDLRIAQTECAYQDESLTRLQLRMDGIEVDAELRARRKQLLKVVQGLQDGDCNVVREAIESAMKLALSPGEQ